MIRKNLVKISSLEKVYIVLLAGVVMSFAASYLTLVFLGSRDNSYAADYLAKIEKALEKSLSEKLIFLESIENFLLATNDFDSVSSAIDKEFSKDNLTFFTQSLEATNPEIVSVELAPDGILQFISDTDRNTLVGLDLLKDKFYYQAVLESIESKQAVISEISLQSSKVHGIVINRAVLSTKSNFDIEYWSQNGRFSEDFDGLNQIPSSYWGTISILLDTQILLNEFRLHDHTNPFSLSIKSIGSSAESGRVIFGDDESYSNAIQTSNFGFSGLEWSLAVSRTDSLNLLLAGSALFLGLILSGVAASQCRLAQTCKRHVDLIAENVNANQAKTQFLATMSHELRTPIHSIMVYAESLVENIYGPISEPQRKVVEHLQKASEHLLELVNDILYINKIESNQLTLDLAKHSVNSACNESISLVQNQVREKNLNLEFNADPRIPDFLFDTRRMKQVLINLLYNAIKFTPSDGHILVETELHSRQSGGSVCRIAVKDSGIGISEEDQKELFQPFKQVDNPLVRKSNGVGLGLYISKSIIELHHGKISIQSSINRGSSFIIDLPIEYGAEDEISDFRI